MRTTRRRGVVVTLVVIVVALALYSAAGFLLVPRLIERQLTALAEQRLGQKLTMQTLKVNPFAFSVEVIGLRLGKPNGLPVLAARRVYLDLDVLGSGFGRGWVLGDGQSEGLQVLLESQKDGQLNVAELAQRWQQASPLPKPDAAPLRITIRHLLAADGMLSYRDVTDKAVTTQVLPIRIELENVSTLPDREGHYTVAARIVGGGALTWTGDLTLRPLQSDGDLELQNLKLATAWKFIRERVRLEEPEGSLTVATHYQFRYDNNKPALSLTRLRAQASGVKMAREDSSAPMLALKSIEIREGSFDLARRSLMLPNVAFSDGHVNVFKDADGAVNWNLSRAGEPGAATVAARSEGKVQKPADAWKIDVKELGVQNVALRYRDLQRRTPLDLQIAQLSGTSGLTMSIGDEVNVHTQDMEVRLNKLRLPAEAPTVQLTQVQVLGGYFDLAEQSLGAKQVVADGGNVRIERGADGSLTAAQMFEGRNATSRPAAEHAPWSYAIESVRVQHVAVALSDRSFGETIAYPIEDVAVHLEKIASAGKKEMTFKAAARIGKGGALSANGTLAQNFSRADANVKIDGVELMPLQPLLARYARVDLVSGKASASAKLAYRGAHGEPSLSASGPFRIDNVRLNEAGTDTLVLGWKRLSTQEARVTLGPDNLRIKQIVAEAPEMRIAISEKRELNLAQLFKHPAAASSQAPAQTSASQTAKSKASPFPVRIGELRLRDGTMDYSDLSLVLPFATHVTNLAGAAVGLGTQSDRSATLDFDGDIGEFGSVQIKGSVQPLSPTTFIDIAASFENVQMPELSPYTATFLGRKVASGKLWVDVKYRIEQGELTGTNDVTVHDLKLGEHVKTPTALELPLDLAVALLTDSNGVIHVAVPVKGAVNDPKFALGTVIREAFANLIRRIVTAPFRALAGLLGGKKGTQDDFGRIEFNPGSARLMASEKEKLQNVAKALEQRPQLKLNVQAPYAPRADRQAMKRERAAREVEQALGRKLQPDEKPAPVVFDSLATQRALERLATEKAGAAAEREWIAQYAKRKGAEPRRAGTILRTKGDPAFYEALFDWIAAIEPVPDAAVQDLAQKRAQAVVETLQAAGVNADRLEAGPAQSASLAKSNRVSAELALERADTLHPAASPDAKVAAQAEDDER